MVVCPARTDTINQKWMYVDLQNMANQLCMSRTTHWIKYVCEGEITTWRANANMSDQESKQTSKLARPINCCTFAVAMLIAVFWCTLALFLLLKRDFHLHFLLHLCSSFAQQPSQPWQAIADVNGVIGARSGMQIAGHATERGCQERSALSTLK